MKNKKMEFTKVFNIFLFFISVGMIIYFCMDNNNLLTLINSIPSLNIYWLILAFVTMLAIWIIDSTVIYFITSMVYPGRYKLKSAFKTTMVGQFFNSITPFAIAGQPMQFLTMIRQGISEGMAISVLIQKFLIYQTTLTIYFFTVIIFKYGYFSERYGAFMPLAIIGFISQSFVVVLLFLFSLNKNFVTQVINFSFKVLSKLHIIKDPESTSKQLQIQLDFYLKNNKYISKNHKLTLKLYLLTFSQITLLFLIPSLIYKAFNNPGFPIIDMVSAQAFVNMISSYTPLPGGSGTSEGSFIIIFNLFFKESDINQAMLLWRFITYYSCIIFGALFAGFGNKKEKMDINIPDLMKQSMAKTYNQ